jgi:hypothetical protein
MVSIQISYLGGAGDLIESYIEDGRNWYSIILSTTKIWWAKECDLSASDRQE